MLKNTSSSCCEDGFTLIELLIVIVIIGILAAIAIPVFLSQAQAARNASVDSDTRNAASKVAQEVAVKGFSTVAADIAALENKLTKSNGNQLKLASAANGNYTVTGWNDDAEKYSVVFTSADGKFAQDKTTAEGASSNSSGSSGGTGTSTAGAPVISVQPIPLYNRVNSAFSYQPVTASGTPNPTYSVSSGTLPAGLSINSSTGLITGTPTVVGTATGLKITVSNTAGSVTSDAFTITIESATYTTVTSWDFDATSSSPWIVTDGTYVRSSVRAAAGSTYSGEFGANSGSSTPPTASVNLTGLTVGSAYQFRISYYSSVPNGILYVTAEPGPGKSNLNVDTASWKSVSYKFVATSTTATIKIGSADPTSNTKVNVFNLDSATLSKIS